MDKRCAKQFHEWQIHQYYCPYIDGHSTRPFPCDSCGDRLNCDGEMVRRVCTHCGVKEWVYSADSQVPQPGPNIPEKEENK